MSERKPVMDKDKRKVLNLLEFISEMCPAQRVCQIMVNCVPPEVLERVNNDMFYIPDADMVGYLQSYADLVSEYRKTHDESGGHGV
jgi:hypothetical protein